MTTNTDLSPELIRKAAAARANKALAHIQRAQDELSAACGELAALTYGVPVWRACHTLTDRVHEFWYRVDAFRQGGRFSLDRTNIEALASRLRTDAEVPRT